MRNIRSVFLVLLIVITASCQLSEKLDDTNHTSTQLDKPQTEEHFRFIEHDNVPAAGSLYRANGSFVGSCVLIDSTRALTAGHCIEQGNVKYARFGSEFFLIDEQFLHEDYIFGDDLGLITFCSPVSAIPIPIMEIDILPPMIPLHTIAHGSREKKISRDGTFNYYGILRNKPNEIVFLPIKAHVWFGDSGGALGYMSWDNSFFLLGIITHFSVIDGKIYECVARRVDNIDIDGDIWQPWFAK